MCIIVYKPKNVKLPKADILMQCFDRNPDGAGYMYRNSHNDIIINKGFMEFKDLMTSLYTLPKDVKNNDIVIHFRIGTSGEKTAGYTHPYPLSDKNEDLMSLNMAVPLALVHNGMLPINILNGLNDTQTLIKTVLHNATTEKEAENILNLFKNKFIIMGTLKTIIVGDGWVLDNGIHYSNSSYKKLEIIIQRELKLGTYRYPSYRTDDLYFKDSYNRNLFDTTEKPSNEQKPIEANIVSKEKEIEEIGSENIDTKYLKSLLEDFLSTFLSEIAKSETDKSEAFDQAFQNFLLFFDSVFQPELE